eukprot:3428060-Amphidinium_carterae.1
MAVVSGAHVKVEAAVVEVSSATASVEQMLCRGWVLPSDLSKLAGGQNFARSFVAGRVLNPVVAELHWIHDWQVCAS